jgi:hypothetical protein
MNANTNAVDVPQLNDHLSVRRCPHCAIYRPNLHIQFGEFTTTKDDRTNQRNWRIYSCKKCGGVITAWAYAHDRIVRDVYPGSESLDENIPSRVSGYLQQAVDSVHSPDGCIMLCASAIDEMLKARGFKVGKLYPRIKEAKEAGVLTEDMSQWAHDVRLDANDQRHSDENVTPATQQDAERCLEFTKTLADLLFVLPARVKRGLSKVQ